MAWKDLGLRDKAPFLRMAAKHGVTDLDAIRSAYDTLGANTMASGGTMRKKKERPKVDLLSRSRERNLRNGYKQWISRLESYWGGLSDDYDYEGYYRADPEEAWRQLARIESGKAPHFPDTYKKRNHATYPDRGEKSWNESEDTFYPSDRQMEDSDRILDYLGSDANYKNGGANVSYAGGKVLPTVYVSPKGNDVDMRPNKQGTGYVYKGRPSEYARGGRMNRFDDGGQEDIIDWGMVDLKAIRDKYLQAKEKSDGYTAVPASSMSYNEGNGLWWDKDKEKWYPQDALVFPGGKLSEVPVVGHRSYRYPVPYDASYNLWDDVSTDELAKYVDAAQDPVRYLVNGWNNHIQYGANARNAIKGEYAAMTRHYKNLADQYGLNYKPEYTPEEFAEHLDINWADPGLLVTRDKYGHLSPVGTMAFTSMERGPHGLHKVSISPAFGRGFPENRIVPSAVHEARHVADNTGLSSTFGLTRDLASLNNDSQQKEPKRGWEVFDELMEKRHPVSPTYEQAFHDVYPLFGITFSGDIFDSAAERMATHSEIQYRLAKRFGLDPNSDDFDKEFAKAVRNMPDDWILQDDDGQLKFPLLYDDDDFPINGYAQSMIPVLSRSSRDASDESPAKGKEWRDNYIRMMRNVLANVRAHGGRINMFDGVNNLDRPNQLTTAFDDLVAARNRYAQTGDIGTSWAPVDLNDVSITDNGFVTREGRTGNSFVLPEATVIGQRPVVNEAIPEEKPDDNSFLGRLRAARNRVKYGHSKLTAEDKAMIRRANKIAAAGSGAIAAGIAAPYFAPYLASNVGTVLNAMQPSTYLDAIASGLGAQVGNYGLGASTMAGALGNTAMASGLTAEGLDYLYNTYLNGDNPRSFEGDLNSALALAPFLAAPAAGAKKLVDLSRNSGRLMTRLGHSAPEINRAIGLGLYGTSKNIATAKAISKGATDRLLIDLPESGAYSRLARGAINGFQGAVSSVADAAQGAFTRPAFYFLSKYNKARDHVARKALEEVFAGKQDYLSRLARDYGYDYVPEMSPSEMAQYVPIDYSGKLYLGRHGKVDEGTLANASWHIPKLPDQTPDLITVNPAKTTGFSDDAFARLIQHEGTHVFDDMPSTRDLMYNIAAYEHPGYGIPAQQGAYKGFFGGDEDLFKTVVDAKHREPGAPYEHYYPEEFSRKLRSVMPIVKDQNQIFHSGSLTDIERNAVLSEVRSKFIDRLGLDPLSPGFDEGFTNGVRALPDTEFFILDPGSGPKFTVFDDIRSGYIMDWIRGLTERYKARELDDDVRQAWTRTFVDRTKDLLTNYRAHGGKTKTRKR